MMLPQNLETAKIDGNEISNAESTIVIIPGVNDIYENMTPPDSMADMSETNPCPSLIDVDNKMYTKMRVPNWYAEGYKTIGVGKAICFMNSWVARSNSKDEENGGTTREVIEEAQGFTCGQGRIFRNSCQGPPVTLPKPISVKPNCSCGINSKFKEISSCDQASKGLSTVQTPREILTNPQYYTCVPTTFTCCQVNDEPLSTKSEYSPVIQQDKNGNPPEDNNTHVFRKQLKPKKDCKTKRCKNSVNSKESKLSPGNSKTSKQSKSKISKAKESSSNSSSMVSQCSQTSLDAAPNELYHQQYHDPNQEFIAEITAYLGKSCIKKRCDPSVVEHLLNNLFGSQLSGIEGIEIRKIRKVDPSCIMHKDQSTDTVESCCCQTKLKDYQNTVDEFCHESKEVTQQIIPACVEEDGPCATSTDYQKSNPVDEADYPHAQVCCSRSFVMQRSNQCLYTHNEFIKPVKCEVYPLDGKCLNCGRNKISQKQKSNTTLLQH